MKKFFDRAVYGLLLISALSFTACQEEFEELPQPDEQQTLRADSETAHLIANTSSNDGSFDNIVDGVSCFAVKFPYTVEVNGIQITIDSREDLQVIEEIFDAIDTDVDVLELFFPITITLADYTEIVIENKEQLIELAKECIEGGGDDDIECIDFVYPITLYTFDVNEEQTGSVTVESDFQLRRFMAGLDDSDLVSIDYPISLKLYDGTEIQVTSNAELAQAIRMAKEACDEDDDNDYNDDDFTQERLENLLVECPWLIHQVERDFVSQTDQYFEYVMKFFESGEVVVIDRAGNVLNGTWSTRVANHLVLLSLEFDVLVDFTLEWFVYELEPGKIKLISGDGNKIVMRSACDLFNDDPNTLREILMECSWIIKKVKYQGDEIKRFIGWEFNFQANNEVTLSYGDMVSVGSWEIATNSQGRLVVALSFGDHPEITFEWPVSDLRNDRLRFEVEQVDYELILQRVCDNGNGDNDVPEVRNMMMGGSWMVAQYKDDGIDETQNFEGFSFDFQADHYVGATLGMTGPTYPGLWRVIRNSDGELKVYLNFFEEPTLDDLTDDWKLYSITNNRIELRDYSGDPNASGEANVDILVFERNP